MKTLTAIILAACLAGCATVRDEAEAGYNEVRQHLAIGFFAGSIGAKFVIGPSFEWHREILDDPQLPPFPLKAPERTK
jgi:hypothetical protein